MRSSYHITTPSPTMNIATNLPLVAPHAKLCNFLFFIRVEALLQNYQCRFDL
jgi:hypothetical protein